MMFCVVGLIMLVGSVFMCKRTVASYRSGTASFYGDATGTKISRAIARQERPKLFWYAIVMGFGPALLAFTAGAFLVVFSFLDKI